MTKRKIGPVAVDVLDQNAALRMATERLARRQACILAFCNAHTVNLARADPAFADALDRATVLNDGVGVDIASRMLHGQSFPDNLNGTDFTPALLGTVEKPLRIFLLGSPPGVAESAADALGRRFPHHIMVGTQHGFFNEASAAEVEERIIACAPDLVLVGMGQPRQEIWAARHASRIGAMIMCIGAYLDFAAGRVPRAPDWVRRFRAEWLFRLAIEPRRMASRYLVGNAAFLRDVMRDRRKKD